MEKKHTKIKSLIISHIQNHASGIASKIITGFDNYFANTYEQNELHSDEPSKEGYYNNFWCVHGFQLLRLAKYYSRILPLSSQLKSFKNLFSHYCNIDVFKDITWQALSDGFIDIVHYANRYFSVTGCNPIELRSKLTIIGKNKPNWKGIVEICLSVPFSNTILEHFFSHMNIIKYETRNRLSQSSLNAVLCMFSMPLTKFSQPYMEDCVTYWYNAKEYRLGKRKCKAYSKWKSTLKKCKTFDIRQFLSESSSESSESDSVFSKIDDELWLLYIFLELFWTILRIKKLLSLLTKRFVIICLCIASSVLTSVPI